MVRTHAPRTDQKCPPFGQYLADRFVRGAEQDRHLMWRETWIATAGQHGEHLPPEPAQSRPFVEEQLVEAGQVRRQPRTRVDPVVAGLAELAGQIGVEEAT